jgi:hypothetical protein
MTLLYMRAARCLQYGTPSTHFLSFSFPDLCPREFFSRTATHANLCNLHSHMTPPPPHTHTHGLYTPWCRPRLPGQHLAAAAGSAPERHPCGGCGPAALGGGQPGTLPCPTPVSGLRGAYGRDGRGASLDGRVQDMLCSWLLSCQFTMSCGAHPCSIRCATHRHV